MIMTDQEKEGIFPNQNGAFGLVWGEGNARIMMLKKSVDKNKT
jgi:hypothetical protein